MIEQVKIALLHALAMAFAMGWEILWALILGFALSAVVQAVVSHAEMSRLLPDDGPRSIAARHPARRRLLVLLLCRGRAGALAVPQGREFHRRDGLRDRFDQSGRRARHHPDRADGLAVRRWRSSPAGR